MLNLRQMKSIYQFHMVVLDLKIHIEFYKVA